MKLTVVGGNAPVPSTGVPKLSAVLNSAAGGVKLSAAAFQKTAGTLWRWLHHVFISTGVKDSIRAAETNRYAEVWHSKRGAKLCLFEYINPRGYPCLPPMKTSGTPS